MRASRLWIAGAVSALLAALAPARATTPPLELRDWTASFDGPQGPWYRPGQLPDADAPNLLWIRLPLPQQRFDEPTLYVLGMLPAFRAVLDGRELARSGDPAQPRSGPGHERWHMVALPDEAAGRNLVLEVYRPQRNTVDVRSVHLAARSQQPQVFLAAARLRARAGAPAFALAVVMMTLGICTIALWAARLPGELALVSFGLVGLLYGLRLAASSELSFWLIELPPLAWRWTSTVLTYVIPVPWGVFFEQIAGRGWRSSIRRMWQLFLAYALTALTIDIAAGVPGRAMGPNSFLVSLTVMVGLGNLFLGGVPKLAERPALRAGYVVFAVFVLAENLGAIGVLPPPFRVEWVGVVVLLLCFGYAVAARTVRQQRQLSALEHELATARRIQRSLLPPSLPTLPWGTLAVRFAPATAVAGDFYDFLPHGRSGVGILLADVSGHGVPAALIASMVKAAAAAQSERADRPGELLAAVNSVLLGQLGSQFVTAVCVHAEGAARRVRLASAGHPSPLLWRRAERRARMVGDGGILMGQFPAATYPTTEFEMEPGDRLLLYTDGVTEADDGSGEFFGSERLAVLLAERADDAGEVFATHLLEALRTWTRKSEAFDDDVSFVVLDALGSDTAARTGTGPP